MSDCAVGQIRPDGMGQPMLARCFIHYSHHLMNRMTGPTHLFAILDESFLHMPLAGRSYLHHIRLLMLPADRKLEPSCTSRMFPAKSAV